MIRLRVSSSFLNKYCEEIKLIELKGKYAVFIIYIESELDLLKHINVNSTCCEKISQLIETRDNPNIWWGNLFSKNLSDILDYDNDVFKGGRNIVPVLRIMLT